jgi:hypothetical protein
MNRTGKELQKHNNKQIHQAKCEWACKYASHIDFNTFLMWWIRKQHGIQSGTEGKS